MAIRPEVLFSALLLVPLALTAVLSLNMFDPATGVKADEFTLELLDDGIMVRAIGMGLCEKQRPNPHLNDIHPAARFRDDLASGVSLTMTGLAYNTRMFADKGWAAPPGQLRFKVLVNFWWMV